MVKRNRETELRVNRLAEYNSRVSKGIVHTPDYVQWMRQEQEWFDKVYMKETKFG